MAKTTDPTFEDLHRINEQMDVLFPKLDKLLHGADDLPPFEAAQIRGQVLQIEVLAAIAREINNVWGCLIELQNEIDVAETHPSIQVAEIQAAAAAVKVGEFHAAASIEVAKIHTAARAAEIALETANA